MSAQDWWAVALTESVTGDKPLAALCQGEELVLFRDTNGKAVALEDRCPHRRVPLSLGCVKANGLQCAYHGWIFDGTSGACTSIPNLSANERVPARYGARPYPVVERDGFVFAWLGANAPEIEPTAGFYQSQKHELTGSAIIPMAPSEYLAAMLDGPQTLLDFDGVQITDFFLGDARRDGDYLILDRGAVWKGQLPPPAFITDHPLIVRTAVPINGGLIHVQLLTADEQPLITICLASNLNRRGTTGICWRGHFHANTVHAKTDVTKAPLRWRLARALNKPAFTIFKQIDGAAVAALLAEPSQELLAARNEQPLPLRFAVND